MKRFGAACPGVVLLFACACSKPAIPDPKIAARRYAEAARRGDAQAMYELMSRSSRRELGTTGTRRLVADSRAELAQRGAAMAGPRLDIQTRARVRFADGEVAELELEHGRFKVTSAAGLPSGARSPVQALAQLRAALARRSYSGLLRVLSRDTQAAIESDLRALVEGLEHPEGLEIKVQGDRAEVTIPGGHVIRLTKEAGLWKIEDF